MNHGSRGWRIATPIAALMAIVVMAMPPTTAGASPADNTTSKELVVAEQIVATPNVTVRQHDALADLMKDSAWEVVATVGRATRTAKGFTMVLVREVAYRLDDDGARVDSLVLYDTAMSRSTPQIADRRRNLDDDVGWQNAIESITATQTRNDGDTARSTLTTMQAGEASRLTLQSGGWRSAAPQFTVRLLVNRDPFRPVAVISRHA